MLTKKSSLHGLFALGVAATLLAAPSPVLAKDAIAKEMEQPIGKVIAVKYSGYATRLQQSVKQTIKVGDPVYAGDQIDVKSGNVVQVALDANQQNVVHIPGDSVIQLSKDRAYNVSVNRGQVFALLDQMEPGTKFRVMTPTAVSTVRGTYFGVKTIGSTTVTSVYRGEVGVSGRLADGKALGAPIPVRAGDRTMVSHAGTRPQEPIRMTEAEFNEINLIIGSLGGIKKPLNYQELDRDESNLRPKSKDSDDNDTRAIDKQKGLEEDSNGGGKVVF